MSLRERGPATVLRSVVTTQSHVVTNDRVLWRRVPLFPMARLKFNIIGKSNGVGLARDLTLLTDALQDAGHDVAVTAIDAVQARRRRSLLSQWSVRAEMLRRHISPGDQADVNLMLEHVWPQYLTAASINITVPNPEWFDRHDRRFLRAVDRVWAKTGYTHEVFSSLGCNTTLIGFDSADRNLPQIRRQRTFFHLAGKSPMKGTDGLLRVWARHPDWPALIVIQHKPEHHLPDIRADNIHRLLGYLDDATLMALQNSSTFHVCLSQTEGWGHYIVEALSVGAVTITVDAPPMNELVTSDRGLLVPYATTGIQRLATTYEFDEPGLEATIEAAIAMSGQECERLGANARTWYLRNKRSFSNRLATALRVLRAA